MRIPDTPNLELVVKADDADYGYLRARFSLPLLMRQVLPD